MTTTTPAVREVVGEVIRRVRPGIPFSLFLDFDGTLVPIASDPSSPRLNERTCETLKRIAAKDSCVVSIISGRAIDDLISRVRLDGLIYAGNHGLEIRGRNLEFVQPAAAACRDRLHGISRNLLGALKTVAGIYVEDKGLSA